MLTAIIPEVLKQLNDENVGETLHLIDNDEMLKKEYYLIYSDIFGNTVYLVVVNAGKELFTPKEPHQLLAKGIVYEKIQNDTYDENGYSLSAAYKLISLPFTKFYNSFEGIAVEDIKKLGNDYRTIFTRKMDGTLITRFTYNNEVYFSTRGKILNFEKNKYWDLINEVLPKDSSLWNPEYCNDETLLFELVGPKNPHVEFYGKDELVYLATFDLSNLTYDLSSAESFMKTKTCEVYQGNSAEEIIKSWDKVQEGIVVQYVNKEDNVVYRVKYKTKAYLSILHVKESASPRNMYWMCVENNLNDWDTVKSFLEVMLAKSAYWEEMLSYYQTIWETVNSALKTLNTAISDVTSTCDSCKLSNITERKDQFFFFKTKVGDELAGICVSYLNNKFTLQKFREILAKKYEVK